MTLYLCDTCIISESHKPKGAAAVKNFVFSQPDHTLFLSMMTIGEIEKGIQLLPKGAKQAAYQQWLDDLLVQFAPQILPLDQPILRLWGQITAKRQQAGQPLGVEDGLIAATALHHGMTLVTRNTRDFQALDLMLYDPCAS